MTNRIRRVEIRQRLVDLTEPEVWVTVEPERVTPTTEVVGRLMGPRCRFSNTVEVAYPLRPFQRAPEGLDGLPRRVVIPEASLWEPESPFLYQGPLELWEGGAPSDRTQISIGLRTITLGPRGLRLNGRPLTLRGVVREHLTTAEGLALRESAHNALLVSVGAGAEATYELADELGFLVFGQLSPSEDVLREADELRHHPCVLGWLVEAADAAADVVGDFRRRHAGAVLGVILREPPAKPLPDYAQLFVCAEEMAPAVHDLPLPRLILGSGHGFPGDSADVVFLPPGTIGWVRT